MSIYQNKIIVSVIVAAYNEAATINDCIGSLVRQTYQNMEIIIVDDSSIDGTQETIKEYVNKLSNKKKIGSYKQKHQGAGIARNLGASHSKGEILVFVDADMTFDKDFLKVLTKPIIDGKTIGTFSQDERFANPENYWARCWNMGRFAATGVYTKNYLYSIIPNPSNKGGIFRAILKSKFNEVDGFEASGDYADDESLVKKLGVRATEVKGAIFYHKNPSSLSEVWSRARWIGSGRSFTGSVKIKFVSLIKFFFPTSLLKGIIISYRFRYPLFLPFKVLYDLSTWISVINSV